MGDAAGVRPMVTRASMTWDGCESRTFQLVIQNELIILFLNLNQMRAGKVQLLFFCKSEIL